MGIFRLVFFCDSEIRRSRLVAFYFSIDRNLNHMLPPYLRSAVVIDVPTDIRWCFN